MKVQAFPLLKNPLAFASFAILFLGFVISLEASESITLPNSLWTLIGMAAAKLFDLANSVLDLYKALIKGDGNEPSP
ncbi:MAG: hypothetical protein F4Y03_10125 [Alphaproteobacteria bacterium]|nr:hypothetical protein [Alphaproteobacteria bacterium]